MGPSRAVLAPLALLALLALAVAPVAHGQALAAKKALPLSERALDPRLDQFNQIIADSKGLFGGSEDASVVAHVAAAKAALKRGKKVDGADDGTVGTQASGRFTVSNCYDLWAVINAANELGTRDPGRSSWTIELSCATNYTNCYDATGLVSPKTAGFAVFPASGRTRLVIQPSRQDCPRGTRPVIGGQYPAGVNKTVGVKYPLFAVGSYLELPVSQDFDALFQSQLTMTDIIIDGGGVQPCIAAGSAQRLTLTNVELRNCRSEYQGAGIWSYDSPIRWRNGAVTGCAVGAGGAGIPYPGSGAGVSQVMYSWRGQLMSIQGVTFKGNVHINGGGAFAVSTYLEGASTTVQIRNGEFADNKANACGVGTVFRADRAIEEGGTRRFDGRMTLDLNGMKLSGNNGAPALPGNGTAPNILLCGAYQQPVQGSNPPYNMTLKNPTRLNLRTSGQTLSKATPMIPALEGTDWEFIYTA